MNNCYKDAIVGILTCVAVGTLSFLIAPKVCLT